MGYWLVSFVPDPTGYYQDSKEGGINIMKLSGCILAIVLLVIASLAYMFGPAVSALLPVITIYKFCKNMWLTIEARQYLKNQ